jgi:hypothetical protein
MKYFAALSWLTGLSLAIGLLVLLHETQLPFFLYYPNTTNTVLISESLDRYLFLITCLCVPGTLLVARNTWTRMVRSVGLGIAALWISGIILLPIRADYGIFLTYLAVVAIALATFKESSKVHERSEEVASLILGATSLIAFIECASAYYWVVAAFSPQAMFGVASQNLERDLTYAAYPIAPLLLLIIMSSWVWVPLLSRTRPRLHGSETNPTAESDTGKVGVWDRRLFLLSLDAFAILSILVFYFLYAAGQLWVVGVDSQYRYVIPLHTLKEFSLFHALAASLSLGHGIYLGLLLIMERLTGLSPFLLVKYAPLMFTFCTSTLTFLAFRGTGRSDFAFLAALCTIFWIPTTIGIWAGIQANWIAYMVWMFFLATYLNRSEKPWWVSFVLQGLLSLGVLMLHPWTWGVFLATIIVASLFAVRRPADFRRGLKAGVSAVWLAVPIGVGALVYPSGVGGDISSAFALYSFPLAHVDSIFTLFPGAWLEMWRVWSSFLSPTLILIALVGAFALNELQGEMKRYLLAWLVVWCLGSVLVAAIGYLPADAAISETQLWRMLYLSPLPILLALGVSKLVNLSSRFVTSGTTPGPRKFARLQPIVLSAAIAAPSLPLFIFATPLIRLGSVIVGLVAVVLLTHRFQLTNSPRLMIAILLILIIVNATFRSLFPLLLDPHNLYLPSSI